MFAFKFILIALTLHYSLSGKNQNFATDTLEKKYGKIIHASVVSFTIYLKK